MIDDIIVEGDKAACRNTLTGTHTGDFRHPVIGALPATGRSFSVDQAHIFRFGSGRIIEHWAIRDGLALLRQLNALP